MGIALVVVPSLLVASVGLAAAPRAPVPIADNETIVFYGDSITEQNLYSAYIETFLLSRLPHKKIACFNFGWGGDTAAGALKRFARDVEPLHPTLVFVNFGMNDGGYQAYSEKVFQDYVEAQRALAAAIKAAGARQVLFTASPVDEYVRRDQGVYNQTLARLGAGVESLGQELDLPVIDLFRPMHTLVRQAHDRDAGFTMIPDSIHPDAVGHLVMAYLALRRIDLPREVGEVAIADGRLQETRGLRVDGLTARAGGLELDLTPPCLPFHVPPAARKALDMVPFQDELNRFRLRVTDLGDEPWVLSVDGVTLGTFPAAQLRQGLDLALLDKAPWSAEARTLWETAQLRWQKHFEAWRRMGLDRPAAMMPDLPSFEAMARAQRVYADDLGRSLSRLAQPRTYRVGLWRQGEQVAITSAELSPAYALEGFDTAYPPEANPTAVAWKPVAFEKGVVDLGKLLGAPTNVAAYVRVTLEADTAATLHLALGSDDGLAVFVGGKRAFAHDVARSLKPGEDETEVSLAPGRNELLFKVTQGAGDFGLAVQADVRGQAHVRQSTSR